MRILTLVAEPRAVEDATRLAVEIRAFNRAIDFRLRFLHMDIQLAFAAAPEAAEALASDGVEVHGINARAGLERAAALALLLHHERPALFVIAGTGELFDAGLAAARVVGIRVGTFGSTRGDASREGARDEVLDLGDDARQAVERMTGVAREIR